MRTQRIVTAAFVALAGTALADRPLREPEPANPCGMFQHAPPSNTAWWWNQRLSVASCRENFDVKTTTNPEEFRAMVAGIERNMEPSYAIYEDTMNRAPMPEIRILGAYALGMAHVDTMVRARTAALVTNAYGGATYGTPDPYRVRNAALEPWLVPHANAATDAFREVLVLALQHPEAARANSVVTFAVANARNELRDLAPREL